MYPSIGRQYAHSRTRAGPYTRGSCDWLHCFKHVRLILSLADHRNQLISLPFSLFGFNCLQTFIYYKRYERDPITLKLLVRLLAKASLQGLPLTLKKVFVLWYVLSRHQEAFVIRSSERGFWMLSSLS